MLRWIQQLGMLVVLVGLAASAWSQTVHYTVPAAFVGGDFSVYFVIETEADTAC